MLEVIHGPFPDLEPAFIERLRALKEAHPQGPVSVVAPSRRLADRLERLAAVESALPLLGVRFHTFFSLASAVVEDSGWPERTLVTDPVFLDRLVDRLLEEEPALGRAFGGEARPRALAAALRASLRDLIDAGADAAGLEEHFGDELIREPRERERLKALLRLKWLYEGRLESLGLLTASGLVRLAAERVPESGLLSGQKAVLYYGFYDLTGVQLEFFEAVTSSCPSAYFLPYAKGHPAYRFVEPFFKERLAGKAVRPAPAREVPAARLSLLSASGARDEVWACAKEILRLVDSGEAGFEEIAFTARSLEPYRAALAEVFAENSIPLDLGAGEPLLRQPAAKAALNLLQMRRRDFPASLVEDIISSPYFSGPRTPRSLHRWREAIRGLGISGGWLQWRKLEPFAETGLPLGGGEDARLVPAEEVASLWSLLRAWNEALGAKPRSWEDLAERAEALLEANLSLPRGPSPEEEAAFARVREALRELARFDALGLKPGWEAFLESLEDKLRRSVLEPAKPPRGVRARDAMDARGERFRVVFLAGLKERLFPRQVQEDPLLRDSTRLALRDPAGYWISQKAAGHEEERLLFHLCVAQAGERLYCVFPRSDEAGKAQVPSLYLRELCRAAGRALVEDEGGRVPRDPAERLRSRPLELLSPKEASLRLTLEGAPAADYWEEAGGDAGLLASCLERLPALSGWGEPGPHDGLVGEPEEFIAALKADGLSPSALDTLAQCPFRFFAQRLLGLSDRDEAAEKGEFAAWVRGKIYHAVLERFHSGKALEAAIEEVFSEYDWRTMGVYPVLWRCAKETMTETLKAFTAWDSAQAEGMKPLWLEKDLSCPWPGKPPKALEGLKVRGIIDRVDATPDKSRYRVVDYKTQWRRKGALSRMILKGELHQLPLYAELAKEALGGKAELDSAAIYAIEAKAEDRARLYTGAEWRKERAIFFSQVAGLLELVASGRFVIKPDDGDFGYCRHCGFSTICRKSHGPSRARAGRAAGAGGTDGG